MKTRLDQLEVQAKLHDLALKYNLRSSVEDRVTSTVLSYQTAGDTWSRNARRHPPALFDGSVPLYKFSCTIVSKQHESVVDVRWVDGPESKVFESFAGMIRSALR